LPLFEPEPVARDAAPSPRRAEAHGYGTSWIEISSPTGTPSMRIRPRRP